MRLINGDILSLNVPQPDPAIGKVLVAGPLMDEAIFGRSVVLMLDHDTAGSLGVVTNKQAGLKMSGIFPDMEAGGEIPVYVGGPVGLDRMLFLHRFGGAIEGSTQVLPGLYYSCDLKRAKELINMGARVEGNIRFFVGYSGWRAGQLRDELDRHSWAVGDVGDAGELIALSGDEAWRNAVTWLPQRHRVWLNFPGDLHSN